MATDLTFISSLLTYWSSRAVTMETDFVTTNVKLLTYWSSGALWRNWLKVDGR